MERGIETETEMKSGEGMGLGDTNGDGKGDGEGDGNCDRMKTERNTERKIERETEKDTEKKTETERYQNFLICHNQRKLKLSLNFKFGLRCSALRTLNFYCNK